MNSHVERGNYGKIFFVAQRYRREPQRKRCKNSAALSVFSAVLCVTKKCKKQGGWVVVLYPQITWINTVLQVRLAIA